jgi:eukaryotic-like serine/threonine-protein kinase
MRIRADFVQGLLDLPGYEDASVRRGVFRQSIASLALTAPVDGPGPLDELDPGALLRSIQIAFEDRLFDDLSWLASSAAAVALYELAGALPLGNERRELGRRVLGMLYEGDAATFVTLATRMATGAARGLSGAGIRARVLLALCLPPSANVAVNPLALAFVARRELAQEWLGARSTGSLPERRLAARLLERAAREAAGRALQGDDDALRLFRSAIQHGMRIAGGGTRKAEREEPSTDAMSNAWRSLLSDRETLVWRHVASARGVLATFLPEVNAEISAMLAPELSPTEWRRGATSLVASLAVAPEDVLPRVLDLARGPLLQRDPGIAAAMLWGIPSVADGEPEAAEEVLDALAAVAPVALAESLAELRGELGPLGKNAAARCAAALEAMIEKGGGDEGVAMLIRVLAEELSEPPPPRAQRDPLSPSRPRDPLAPSRGRRILGLREAIAGAIDAFVEVGPREANARAQRALAYATEALGRLEALTLDPSGVPEAGFERGFALTLLRELDLNLFETGKLKSLLVLDRRPSDEAGGVGPLDDVDERFARWLLDSESAVHLGEEPPPHVNLHQRKLRALLHLIDGETTDFEDEPDRRARVHDRWTSTCRVLLSRLSRERGSPLRRAMAATTARALDALVRDAAADPADILLFAAMRVDNPNDLEVLAEASMHPDVTHLLQSYARFVRAMSGGAPVDGDGDRVSAIPLVTQIKGAGGKRPLPAPPPAPGPIEDRLATLEAFVAEIPSGASQRTEGARSALSRLCRALAALETTPALRLLTDVDASPLVAFEAALDKLAQLTLSARRRCGDATRDEVAVSIAAAFPLALAAGRAMSPGADPAAELRPSIDAVVQSATASIPKAIADVIASVLPKVASLPLDARPPSLRTVTPVPLPETRLPAWMPSRRVLGGFYVQRPLGSGAAGSVFVVTRADERHDPGAERLALKVPDYNATAARSLSEADFLKLFRQEASALLAIPEHPNLARFVTFDAGARPKPILVMELVEGPRSDQLIASRLLAMHGALEMLDGVLAGLEAMHSVGVGHLDIKPSNVVLRAGQDPVLVDFGLAGRHIRPGCATGSYGAPEVWASSSGDAAGTPEGADVYAFACLAYEVMTTRTLFDAPNEVALISAHLTHDGMPPAVKRMADDPKLRPLAMFLYPCLRRDPKLRPSASALRGELKRLGQHVLPWSWPVEAGA